MSIRLHFYQKSAEMGHASGTYYAEYRFEKELELKRMNIRLHFSKICRDGHTNGTYDLDIVMKKELELKRMNIRIRFRQKSVVIFCAVG